MKTNTRIDTLVPWNPEFDRDAAIFDPLREHLSIFRHQRQWPTLKDYQNLLDRSQPTPRTRSGATLTVVPQAGKPSLFEQHYAPRIHQLGEIQTRTQNWHDFFQLLTWLLFPKTKALINALHVPVAHQRLANGGEAGRRSPLENMLSLFDEGGAILLSSDASLLQSVREFRWKDLFWHRRADLNNQFECIVFGHALYEKGLKPYLGMTANTILLETDRCYFAQPLEQRLTYIDHTLEALLEEQKYYTHPRDLQPFPLLGLPGWDPANRQEQYYDNVNYFRPGRRLHSETA